MGLKTFSENFLVPKHEIVPEEKAAELLQKYGADRKKLPQILRDDPMVLEINAKKGDLIRVIRDSPTAGRAVYYRIVV